MTDLIDGCLRKAACAFVYIVASPLRLAFAAGFTIIIPLFLLLALTVDLYAWGCKQRYMPYWDDWTVLESPKFVYWDFLILGKWS